MKKVGVYGGAFDPPHIGHIMNITAVINSQWMDEVWLVPTGRHRFKPKTTAAEQRRAMVEIMLATVFGAAAPIRLDTTEIDRPERPSTTIDLLAHLRARHPDCEFSVIIGADLIAQIPAWERGTELLASTPFLVVPRLGCPIPDTLPPAMRVVPTEYHTDVSSSTLREMISQGQCVDGLIPSAVLTYIMRNELYKKEGE